MRTPATNISSLCGLSCLVLSLCIFIGLPAPATAVADDQIFIRINQLGYQSRQPKLVIAFARSPLPEKFCVIDAQSNHVAFNGTAKPLAGRWGEFPYHVELDFSSLQQTGRYFIEIGKGKTRTFEISDSTYAGVPDELLEFMRQQRCGYVPDLLPQPDRRLESGPRLRVSAAIKRRQAPGVEEEQFLSASDRR